ncbi:MAG: hypothetical protein HY313_07605 [Acidobacteria bacterium]|nr:hypothetical protein [Acidobacteriota bacterium]
MNVFSKILFILFFCSHSSAYSQIKRGTVGVIYFTDDKIVMAADSRGSGRSDETLDDKQCKVTALGKQIVFISAGFSGYQNVGTRDLVPTWSNSGEAHSVYGQLRAGSGEPLFIYMLASEWARRIVGYLNLIYRAQPQTLISASEAGVLTSALFGGLAGNDRLIILYTRITIDPTKLPAISFDAPRPAGPPLCAPWCILGKGAVATEYLETISPRAMQESAQWREDSKRFSLGDRDALLAIRLVDLTLAYEKNQGVGGPIDALELTPGKGVSWIQRKDSCPAD